MRAFFRLIVYALLTSTQPLLAQWIQTNGPFDGSGITAIIIHGDVLFAGTENDGIFRSADKGASWITTNSGLPADTRITTFAVEGTTLFAGTAGEGVFYSENNGVSWTANNKGLSNRYINTLAIMDTLLFAGTDAGVFQSIYNGANWTPVGLPETAVYSLVVSGPYLFAIAWQGLFRSRDRGASWSSADSGLAGLSDDYSITALAVSGDTLFATQQRDWENPECRIFRSGDQGTRWISTGTTISLVYALAVKGNLLFAGTGNGLLRSSDNGASWTAVNSGSINQSVMLLAVKEPYLFAGTIGALLFLSPDNGESWSTTGLPNSQVNLLVVNGAHLFASDWRGNGLFLSRNNGTNWITVNNGLAYGINALSIRDSVLFAGTSNGIFWSGDTGKTWIASIRGLTCSDVRALVIRDTDIFAGSMDDSHRDGGVFRSSDNGASWTPTGLINTQVSTLAWSGNFLFAGTWWGAGIFRSGDQGTTWVPSGLAGKDISVFTSVAGFLFAGTYNNGVFCTSDNGVNWTATNNGLTNQIISAFAVSGTNLFAATYGGVFISRDKGAHWTAVNDGLTNLQIRSLAVSRENLFAGTWGDGVWLRPLPEIITAVADNGESNAFPTNYYLGQNYPNPFNPVTTIEFALPQSVFVTLKVYNLLGEEVATRVKEQQAAGHYNVVWDAAGFSAGLYFCRMDAGDYVKLIKLVLVQ